jgi:hypothetical protein
MNWDLKTPIEAKRFLEKLPRLKFADLVVKLNLPMSSPLSPTRSARPPEANP